jgi:L-ascorbate metabolism protein UlaG (beta-lactamase superfamily)
MEYMKVTRFTQSCLMLEKDVRKIVIDPGAPFIKKFGLDILQDVDAVLFTHQHADHFSEEVVATLSKAKAQIYANAATARLIGTEKCTVVNSLDSFNVAGFTVVAYELPHCLMPSGDHGPQNTGYVVDSLLFHPGDGTEFSEPIDLKVPNVAAPISGPDISFRDAFSLATTLGATRVIPIHYDIFHTDPQLFVAMSKNAPFKVTVLGEGESTELGT